MIKGHMEVWDILKDHIEMTVELKLEQLFYMILSSIPVESVHWTSKGDPPVTRTLLQVAAQHGDTKAVQILLEHGVDPEETSDEEKSPMKFAAENNNDEIVEILREAIGGEIPDDVKILQLSKAMYANDKDKFSELLSSISPELVSSTGVNHFGSVLQDAVFDGRWDFIRLLLEHGVDPTVGSDTKEETSVEIAMQYSEYRKIPLLNLFAEFVELPAEIRIKHVKLQIQHGSGGWDVFKKQIESP